MVLKRKRTAGGAIVYVAERPTHRIAQAILVGFSVGGGFCAVGFFLTVANILDGILG